MRSWFLSICSIIQRVICLSKTSKSGMICETRGKVWEGGHPRVKTEKFLQILVNFGKSGVKYVHSNTFNLLYNYLDLITSLTSYVLGSFQFAL